MSTGDDGREVLTLEPLLEAVREGVEEAGWSLSGLQKTTSHRFEGRWEGESTRSAYLFFHRADLPDWVSIDVYLDETSRGLRGNLALVLDGPDLGDLGPASDVLELLSRVSERSLPDGYRTPITFRIRLRDRHDSSAEAETEYRFKIHLPESAVKTGRDALVALAGSAVSAFEALFEDDELHRVTQTE